MVDAVDGSIKIKEEVTVPNTSYHVTSEIEGSLKDFVITLTKFDDLTEKEEVIAKDQYIYSQDGMFFWRKPLSLSNTAKSFDKVYNGKNLKETIVYFYENLYNFDENGIKDYSKKMLKVIEKDKNAISPMNDYILNYITDEAYDIETNELDISKLSEDAKEIVDFIKNSEIYKLSRYFYATEGKVDYQGFVVSIDSWTFEMLKPALDFVYPDRYTPHDYYSIKPFFAPNFNFHSIKEVENSMIAYPIIYVYSNEDIREFEGAKTWKANVIMPVEILEN